MKVPRWWKDVDPSGAVLRPGRPNRCQGNGRHPDFECCCDECDWLMLCDNWLVNLFSKEK